MIIECLVRRCGPTTVELEKTKYLFVPVPFGKKGVATTSICDVTAPPHVEYFLKRPSFREYDSDTSRKDQIEYEKTLGAYIGFSVSKYQDRGYIVVDSRDKKNPKYGDSLMRWTDQEKGLSPFSTEYQAWEFLKEEVDSGLMDPVEESPKKGKREINVATGV